MDKQSSTPLQRLRKRLAIPMTGTNLKIYGCITMVFYTLSMSVIQNGLIRVNDYSAQELSDLLANDADMMLLSGWASVFQLIGGLAVPVFAFLLVEGFIHTSSYRRYLLSVLGFAVLSEVPYDLAMYDSLWDMSGQNALFTLAICLIMLYALQMFVDRKGVLYWIVQGVIVLAAVLWCSLLRTGFGLCTVLVTAIFYLLYEKNGLRIVLGSLVSIMYVTGPLSGYALWSYNGERGGKRNKYLFYAFYPAHLLVLGIAARIMAMYM